MCIKPWSGSQSQVQLREACLVSAQLFIPESAIRNSQLCMHVVHCWTVCMIFIATGCPDLISVAIGNTSCISLIHNRQNCMTIPHNMEEGGWHTLQDIDISLEESPVTSSLPSRPAVRATTGASNPPAIQVCGCVLCSLQHLIQAARLWLINSFGSLTA